MHGDIENQQFGWYWLALMVECGIVTLEKFVEVCGSVEDAMKVSPKLLDSMNFLKDHVKAEILKHRDISVLYEEYNKLPERGIHFVGRTHPDFPPGLKHVSPCPLGLFYVGKLPDPKKLSIAVVGARAASAFGLEMAQKISGDLSRAGVQIVSGLALGIDGSAHRGALENGKNTFGVLGCGVNICYPKENMEIFEQMKTEGGILSEFPLGTPPVPWHFPFRNRIISGLSDGILVVEARQKSGSLITASLGLEQGKDIFAVPGRPVDALSAGCNSLICDGARLVSGAGDILEEYGISEKLEEKNKIGLAYLENLVYSSLCLDAKSIGTVSGEVQLGYAQTAKLLFSLEKKGYVRQVGKNQYIRKL